MFLPRKRGRAPDVGTPRQTESGLRAHRRAGGSIPCSRLGEALCSSGLPGLSGGRRLCPPARSPAPLPGRGRTGPCVCAGCRLTRAARVTWPGHVQPAPFLPQQVAHKQQAAGGGGGDMCARGWGTWPCRRAGAGLPAAAGNSWCSAPPPPPLQNMFLRSDFSERGVDALCTNSAGHQPEPTRACPGLSFLRSPQPGRRAERSLQPSLTRIFLPSCARPEATESS